jgi:hypothetical protein
MAKKDWLVVFGAAVAAGEAAGTNAKPAPMMVVARANPLDDNSPVEKAWHVPEGVCGFAWVNVKAKGIGARFINALRKAGYVSEYGGWRRDHYYGGYTFWVRHYGQSYERKMAYADAFAAVLKKHGVPAYATGRLD